MRMPSTPKAFAPHEWVNAPELSSSELVEDRPSGPLTYHMYSPAELPAPRPRSPSRVSFVEPPKAGASLGLRVCYVLLAVCAVVGTAVAVVASSEEPPAATAIRPAVAAPTMLVEAAPLEPAPLAPILIPEPELPAVVAAAPPAKSIGAARPRPASTAAAAPRALPPNTFAIGAPQTSPKRK